MSLIIILAYVFAVYTAVAYTETSTTVKRLYSGKYVNHKAAYNSKWEIRDEL